MLDDMHVPVDCLAGTGMGVPVGGGPALNAGLRLQTGHAYDRLDGHNSTNWGP
jgi:hypothetical protein